MGGWTYAGSLQCGGSLENSRYCRHHHHHHHHYHQHHHQHHPHHHPHQVGRTGTFLALYKLWLDYKNPDVSLMFHYKKMPQSQNAGDKLGNNADSALNAPPKMQDCSEGRPVCLHCKVSEVIYLIIESRNMPAQYVYCLIFMGFSFTKKSTRMQPDTGCHCEYNRVYCELIAVLYFSSGFRHIEII